MRCPICGIEIEEFLGEVILKEVKRLWRITKEGRELADEETEYSGVIERCYCPACDAEFVMNLDEAKELLKGNAILVDKDAPMKIVEVETEFGTWERIAVVKFNNELYFSDPKQFQIIIKHNETRRMLLFLRKYPIKIKLPKNLDVEEIRVFEWCPSCSEYTYHIKMTENVMQCERCGHRQWY